MSLSFPQMPQKLTATEQAILEYIMKHRDGFLCLSIAQLSAELGISEATISRFARHVGCSDFKHLKRLVVEQTVECGPAKKLTNTLQTGNGDLLQYWMEQQQYNLQKTFELLNRADFDRAVEALKQAQRVFIFAKNASRAPAQLLEFRLRRLGIQVHRIAAGGTELLEELAAVSRQDLVIMFGFSKISAECAVIMDYQEQIGYETLLFTGRMYQQEEEKANINLFVYRGEEQAYHSMSAPVAVVDALVLALSGKMGDDAMRRLEKVRNLKQMYGDYV